MADFLTESNEKVMERRMKERGLILGLDVSAKKKKEKESNKISKDLAMRIQLEGTVRQMGKQTNRVVEAEAANDKTIKENCVKELVNVLEVIL